MTVSLDKLNPCREEIFKPTVGNVEQTSHDALQDYLGFFFFFSFYYRRKIFHSQDLKPSRTIQESDKDHEGRGLLSAPFSLTVEFLSVSVLR